MNAQPRVHLAVALAATTLAVALGACAPSSGTLGTLPPGPSSPEPSVVQSAEPTAPPTAPPSASPAGSASTPPSASVTPTRTPSPTSAGPTATPSGTTIVRAYFLRPNRAQGALAWDLVPVLRSSPKTVAVARTAVNALLAGPATSEDLQSLIPSGVSVRGLSIDAANVATVDLSSEFAGGGASASQIARAAEVVYTLTQFSNVDGVLFRVEGSPLAVPDDSGRTRLDAVGRTDYLALLPPIWVDRPASGASIGNPAHVAGLANVFEATFRIALLDAAGRTLADQQAMATCGTGCWGTFDETVPYTVAAGQWGRLRVYDLSAKDGSPENVREEPVWLTPAD
jgi:spore germination protein GerM